MNYDFIIDEMTFSFSRLNTYLNCPHEFLLNYIKCLPKANGFFGEYGSFNHTILEKFSRNELEIFEMADFYQNEYCNYVIENAPYNKYVDLNEKYYVEGLEYYKNFEGFGDYDVVGVEKEYKFDIDGIKMISYVDLILRDKQGHIHIADHKSSTIKKGNSKKAQEYWKQMYLYSIPITQEYEINPKQLHINAFKENKWYTIDFDKNEVVKVKEWVKETVEQIKKEELWGAKPEYYYCQHICNQRFNCYFKGGE